MWFPSLRAWRKAGSRPKRPAPRRTANFVRLTVEALEDRTVPAFLAPVSYPGGALALAVGDFDNDGLDDLVSADVPAGTLTVRLGSAASPLQVAGTSPYGLGSVAVGDFNRDGNLDVVEAESGVVVLLGNGDGTLRAAQSVGLPDLDHSAQRVNVGDLNNDGNPDLVIAASGVCDYCILPPTYFDVLLGRGDGTFTALTPFEHPSYAEVLADFNGDGNLDIATAQYILPGNGNGTFQAPVLVIQDGGITAAADLNADGNIDLVTGQSVLAGNGDGTFRLAYTFAADTYAWKLAFADFNRDGKVDLAMEDIHPDRPSLVAILLGNGDGTYQAPRLLLTGIYASALAAGDFDGNGFPDLVVAREGSTDLLVFFNDSIWDGTPPPPPLPSVWINDAHLGEGDSGTTNAVFTLTLSSASQQAVTVAYATSDGATGDGDALAGSDYLSAAGTLTFAPGETSKTIAVAVLGDTLVEPTERFFVHLTSAGGAVIGHQPGVGYIVNDDFVPALRVSDVTRNEGRGGTTLFTFTVTLSVAYDAPVTVNFATADGSAKAGEDYVSTSGTLTFAPGETTKTITVLVKGDRTKEADETFFVNLSEVVNALLADGQGRGTILNDDGGKTR